MRYHLGRGASMAMGRRERSRQRQIFVDTTGLHTAGHPFYQRLNEILSEHGFDDFVEQLCAKFYDEKQGRPSIAPGVYFRMLLIGYFEGIDSERGIAWRSADSLALREFLGFELDQNPPDHSSVSRTRVGWTWIRTSTYSSGSSRCWRKKIWSKAGRWELMRRPWKPTLHCDRSCVATAMRATTNIWTDWPRHQESRLLLARIERRSTRSDRRRL